MRYIKINAVAILGVLLFAISSQAKEWRGIVPLKSTRADVERLLGQLGEYGRYQFKDERVVIHYAEGPCDRVDNCWCLVPAGTVLSIRVVLEIEMRFSQLNIDKTKYERRKIPQDPTTVIYSNDKEGIVYTVDDENDDVMSIEYLPASEDCEKIIKSRRRLKPSTRLPRTRPTPVR